MLAPDRSDPLSHNPAAAAEYQAWLNGIKQRIHATRVKGALPTVEEIEQDLQLLQARQMDSDGKGDGMKTSSFASGRGTGGVSND